MSFTTRLILIALLLILVLMILWVWGMITGAIPIGGSR
jgi:hypothetical protein